MTKREFLLEMYREKREKSQQSKRIFLSNPSTARIEPFKIADGLYYVGDKKVCIHLIDTVDGLILLDSGYYGTAHLLIDSIWRLGFDPANVRWIIHSHGHHDHFGASEEFRLMYGTKLAISKIDSDGLRDNPILAAINPKVYPYAEIPRFDYEIEDGEIFTLGKTKIRCVLTPGHTDGVLSFFFDVTENGNKYVAGMFGGAGVNAIALPFIERFGRRENCAEEMLLSIDKIWNEPVTIHLGNHPANNKTLEKRAKQLDEGGNPFVDAESWHNFLCETKIKIRNVIAENEELKKKIMDLD